MIGSWYAAEALTLLVVFGVFALAFGVGWLWDRTPMASRIAVYVERADMRLDKERMGR